MACAMSSAAPMNGSALCERMDSIASADRLSRSAGVTIAPGTVELQRTCWSPHPVVVYLASRMTAALAVPPPPG